MPAVRPDRKIGNGPDRIEPEVAVEMREQRPAARGLVAKGISQRIGVDPDEDEIGNTGEMPRRSFSHLVGGGEMNEPIGMVDRSTGEPARFLGLAPQGTRAYLVDR